MTPQRTTYSRLTRREMLKLSAAMVSYWTQFAATGDPNRGGLPEWPAYDLETDMHLELGRAIKAGKNLHKKRLDVLEAIMYGK